MGTGQMLTGAMTDCVGTAEARASAVVLPFALRRLHPLSFNVSDRIQAITWADAARAEGVRELRIHDPEHGEDPSLGGFMLFYTALAIVDVTLMLKFTRKGPDGLGIWPSIDSSTTAGH